MCTLSANNAGVKDIEVRVEELGYARTNDGVSFEYLLELDSVSPTSGTYVSCQQIYVFYKTGQWYMFILWLSIRCS